MGKRRPWSHGERLMAAHGLVLYGSPRALLGTFLHIHLSIILAPFPSMEHSNRFAPFAQALARGLLACVLALQAGGSPAAAQSCYTQDGQTICCDNSGRCYRR